MALTWAGDHSRLLPGLWSMFLILLAVAGAAAGPGSLAPRGLSALLAARAGPPARAGGRLAVFDGGRVALGRPIRRNFLAHRRFELEPADRHVRRRLAGPEIDFLSPIDVTVRWA
jgi:hypothetical protein